MWRRAIEARMVWKLGAALKTQSITDRSNDYWLVYRVEDVDCCYMYSTPWQQELDYAKAYQDELRTRRSRFAGTLVRRDLRQGRVAWIPYEVERKRLARRLGAIGGPLSRWRSRRPSWQRTISGAACRPWLKSLKTRCSPA